MVCNCSNILRQLEILSEEILAEGDEEMQWKAFDQFLKKYIGDGVYDLSSFLDKNRSDIQLSKCCSLNVCSLLALKLDKFRRRDTDLSTFLVDLITIVRFKYCARFSVLCSWNFDNPMSFTMERDTIRVLSAFRTCCWINSDFDFMKLLMKFGVLTKLPPESPVLILELEFELAHLISDVSGCTSQRNLHIITKQTMEYAKNFSFLFYAREYHKRMFLAVMAIRGIVKHLREEFSNKQMAEAIFSCLRNYFTATREAFLTVFEVRSVLHASFKHMNKLHMYETYCEEFEKLMPESPVKMEPRKLSHLTRCQIRDNLKVSHLPLPSAIEKLFSPKSLLPICFKNFLLGEVHDIAKVRLEMVFHRNM